MMRTLHVVLFMAGEGSCFVKEGWAIPKTIDFAKRDAFRCGLKNRLFEKRAQKELQNSIALSLQFQTSLSGKIENIM